MADKHFDDFVNQQLEIATNRPTVDWEQKRDDWLNHLDEFYDVVKRLLGNYIEQKKISTNCSKKWINEEHIGDYEAPSLEVQIGAARIVFDPVGTNLIGARGRVDMHGPYGIVKFVFVPSSIPGDRIVLQEPPIKNKGASDVPDEHWEWKIATPPPSIQYVELEEEAFLSAIMEIASAS